MNKIDYKGIFGKSVDDNYQELVNRLTMFFDKNIFEVKDDAQDLHDIINGLTYMCRLDADSTFIDVLKEIMGQSDGRSVKSDDSLNNIKEYLRKLFNIRHSNTKALIEDSEEMQSETMCSPVYFTDNITGRNLDKIFYSSDAEIYESMYNIVDSLPEKDKIISFCSPMLGSVGVIFGGGSEMSDAIVFCPMLLNHTDNKCDTNTNYIFNISIAYPKRYTDLLKNALSKIMGEEYAEEYMYNFINLLKDEKIILGEDEDNYLAGYLSFLLVLLLWSFWISRIQKDIEDNFDVSPWGYRDPETGEITWKGDTPEEQDANAEACHEAMKQEFTSRISISNVKKDVVDVLLGLAKDNHISIKFTEFTFDDKKMEVLDFKDYYDKRKTVQHPTTTYDDLGLETLYSIPVTVMSVDKFETRMDSTGPTTVGTIVPYYREGDYPRVMSAVPFTEYKDYILRLRTQIQEKWPDQLPTPVEDTWEDDMNTFIRSSGIHEDYSIVFFANHAPIWMSAYNPLSVVDLYNKDMKVNAVIEPWTSFADMCVNDYGLSQEQVDEWYNYIFWILSNSTEDPSIIKELGKDGNTKSSDVTDDQLRELADNTRTVAHHFFIFYNANNYNPYVIDVDKDHAVYYPYTMYVEPCRNMVQVHSGIEDEHVIVDSAQLSNVIS